MANRVSASSGRCKTEREGRATVGSAEANVGGSAVDVAKGRATARDTSCCNDGSAAGCWRAAESRRKTWWSAAHSPMAIVTAR